jgi:hypothetical protein
VPNDRPGLMRGMGPPQTGVAVLAAVVRVSSTLPSGGSRQAISLTSRSRHSQIVPAGPRSGTVDREPRAFKPSA